MTGRFFGMSTGQRQSNRDFAGRKSALRRGCNLAPELHHTRLGRSTLTDPKILRLIRGSSEGP